MAATLLKSIRATNCLQTVARRVAPRVSCVSLIHCRQEKRNLHICCNTQTLLTPQIETSKLLKRLFSVEKSFEEISEKVLNICQAYDKIIAEKIPLMQTNRSYSEVEILAIGDVEKRIMLVLQLYDKVNPEKLTLTSHFMNDLGLDSLDHVEVIMAMEDEFGFEIPDTDAERLMTPKDIAQYVCDKEDAFEL